MQLWIVRPAGRSAANNFFRWMVYAAPDAQSAALAAVKHRKEEKAEFRPTYEVVPAKTATGFVVELGTSGLNGGLIMPPARDIKARTPDEIINALWDWDKLTLVNV